VDHDLVVERVQKDQVVFRQQGHDRVVPHSNAPAPRLNLLPAANDLAAEVQAANPASLVPAPRLNLIPVANDPAAEVQALDPVNRVQGPRLDLLPGSNDLAAVARPISNLAVSSICREIVILAAKDPSLIADKNDLVLRVRESPATATGSPNDAIVFPTGVRNRSRTEQTD
jgi:hypothetical protein